MAINPTSATTNGYHLFLEPRGEFSERCDRVIHALAKRYGGPVFPPHITLAACIDLESDDLVLEKTALLASELLPFAVSFQGLGGEAAFFRALYVEIERSPELMHAHDRAGQIFQLDSSEFHPHLSLMYGCIDDATRDTIGRDIDTPAGSFLVDSIHVYRTQGTTDAWEKLGEYAFGA